MKSVYVKFLETVLSETDQPLIQKGLKDVIAYVTDMENQLANINLDDIKMPELQMWRSENT